MATGGRAAKFICILAIVVAVPTTIAAFVMSRFIVYSIAATAMFGVFFVVGSVVAVVTAVMATGGAMGVILALMGIGGGRCASSSTRRGSKCCGTRKRKSSPKFILALSNAHILLT